MIYSRFKLTQILLGFSLIGLILGCSRKESSEFNKEDSESAQTLESGQIDESSAGNRTDDTVKVVDQIYSALNGFS